MPNCVSLTLQVDGAERPLHLAGRVAWAVHNLIEAGREGCTPLTHVGPRWSDYVFKARRAGLDIETVAENHGGTFAGRHARYVLRSNVEVVDQRFAS